MRTVLPARRLFQKKYPATRHDLTFIRNGLDSGAGEVGKEDLAGIGKRGELVKRQLHCPKILKDMANLTAEKYGNKELRDIRLVAYN